ncbi:MAG: hypothetical protein WBP64_06340 [Nitrososphaeraceae archaeon]
MTHIITFVVVAAMVLSLLVVVAHAQAKSKDQQKNQNQTLAKEEVPKVGVCVVGIKSACNGPEFDHPQQQ